MMTELQRKNLMISRCNGRPDIRTLARPLKNNKRFLFVCFFRFRVMCWRIKRLLKRRIKCHMKLIDQLDETF